MQILPCLSPVTFRILALDLAVAAVAAGCDPDAEHNPGSEIEPASPLPDCAPEQDGAISAAEMPLLAGIRARYARNQPGFPVPFDPDGEPDGNGVTVWDFRAGPEDVGATFENRDPRDVGLDARFPDATLASGAALEYPSLLGLYRLEAGETEQQAALLLLGSAQAGGSDAASRTELRWEEPVAVLRLPLQLGDAWSQRAVFRDARLGGLPQMGVEDHEYQVDAAGRALLPGGIELDGVLRLRLDVRRTLAVAVGDPESEEHRALWLAPCWGEVARASGTDPALREVDELRRYLP
jgi:hypothetical protein